MAKNLLKDLIKSETGKQALKALLKAVSGFQALEPTQIEDEEAKAKDLARMNAMQDDMWGTHKEPASLEHTRQVFAQSQPEPGVHFLQSKKFNPEHRERPFKAYELGHGDAPGRALNDGMAMSHADLIGHLQEAAFDPHRTVIAPSHGGGDWVQFTQHKDFRDHAKNVIGNLMHEASKGPAAWHETVQQTFKPKSMNSLNPQELAMLRKK